MIALMAQGRSNTAIATSLHLSAASVEKHIRSIFTKLDLSTAPDTHRRVSPSSPISTIRPGDP